MSVEPHIEPSRRRARRQKNNLHCRWGGVYTPLRMFPLLSPDAYESFHLKARRDLHVPRGEVEFPPPTIFSFF